MNYVYESIFVGVYCSVIYFLLNIAINNIYCALFLTGFIKHFCGYLLGLHTAYCNYGSACNNVKKHNIKTAFYSNSLLLESIIEGFLFLGIGLIFILIGKKIGIWTIFFIAVLLHIIAENTGVHTLFCKTRCRTKQNKVI